MSTRKSRSKPRRPSPKKADAKLVRENEELRRERDESLARETATSDILRMIARSPAQLPIMGQCQAFVLTYYTGKRKREAGYCSSRKRWWNIISRKQKRL